MMTRRVTSGTAVAAALCVALTWACRSAASVIFDLPPSKPAPAATSAPATQGGAAAAGQRGLPAGMEFETAPEPAPPIESVRDRDSVLAMLPTDKAGRIDWVEAARRGIVRPRPELPGRRSPRSTTSGFDFYFKVDDAEYEAYFPHSGHGAWLECRGCHPAVYKYRGTRVDMDKIDNGQSCGVCHRTVAFSTVACYRCHTSLNVRERDKVKADLGKDLTMSRVAATPAGAAATPPARSAGAATGATTGTTTGAKAGEGAGSLDAYPLAKFSHWVHRIRYQCTACHPEQFALKAGATKVTMDQMSSGAACGACHNRTDAFGLDQCERCHVAPPAKAP